MITTNRNQTQIFNTKHICAYCGESPSKNNMKEIFDGFIDGDTGTTVCFKCKDKFYKEKWKQKQYKGLYSEYPIFLWDII